MSTRYLDDLNADQRRAVEFGDGPLLVIAGAGTGKTRTLACRVAHLIEQGIGAERILLLTFTRRAASVMVRQAERMLGSDDVRTVWGGTFHAVANRLLHVYGHAIGLAPDFTILDQGDAGDLLNLIRHDLGFAKAKTRFPKKQTLLDIYSHTVNAQSSLDAVLKRYFPWCAHAKDGIVEIFEAYVDRKSAQNVLDFDDLLLFWKALSELPEVGDVVGRRFEHVLVDEYQDTNSIQSGILRGMRRNVSNIMAVGDDAQSIYSFRAATVRNMLDFPDHFSGAETMTLEQNYRSTQQVLDASNTLMEQAGERYTKNLFSHRPAGHRPVLLTCADEPQQCNAVCDRILEHRERGVMLMDQAVLFRAGHHSAELEVELNRRKIPFHKYGGLKFIEAAHVKDMLAFLRILENPFDAVSWLRLLQLLTGVGPQIASRMMRDIGVRTDSRSAGDCGGGRRQEPFSTPLAKLRDAPPVVPSAARDEFEGIRLALLDCLDPSRNHGGNVDGISASGTVAVEIERLRLCYAPIFERIYDKSEMRLRDLEQLELIAAGYQSRGRFIADMTLDPPSSTSDLAGPPVLDEDYLVLSTIHSAKGCEWDVVHIIHVADGMLPSDMSTGDEEGIDEERRLLYVAMTRAKNHLYLYFPLRYYHTKHRRGDGHSYAQLSRFVSPKVRSYMNLGGGTKVGDDDVDTSIRVDSKSVRDQVRNLWRS